MANSREAQTKPKPKAPLADADALILAESRLEEGRAALAKLLNEINASEHFEVDPQELTAVAVKFGALLNHFDGVVRDARATQTGEARR